MRLITSISPVFIIALTSLTGTGIMTAHADMLTEHDAYAREEAAKIPAAEFFATADKAALDDCRVQSESWEYLADKDLVARLDALEARMLREAKLPYEETINTHGLWRDAFTEFALRPAFQKDAVRRFVSIVKADARAFDHGLYARLAWGELERRIMTDRKQAKAIHADRSADELWRAANQVADKLIADNRRSKAKITMSGEVPLVPVPSEDNGYCAHRDDFHRLACDAIAGETSVSVEQIQKWHWGSWCGTGSQGFNSTQNLATTLTAVHGGNIPTVRDSLHPLTNAAMVSFDRYPLKQELRIQDMLTQLEAMTGADFDAEWLGAIIATRRTNELYSSDLRVRMNLRGGDAIAGALIRLIDSPGTGNSKETTDKTAIEALRFLAQTPANAEELRRAKFIGGISTTGSFPPQVEIATPDSLVIGSYGRMRPLMKPARPVSGTMRQKISSRLPPEIPSAK